MKSHQKLHQVWRVIVGGIGALFLAVSLTGSSALAAAESQDAETIARMAMSTASLWMLDKHEHEIAEALEDKDFEEALEEAEELVPWMKGTPWLADLDTPAEAATSALQALVEKLKSRDEAGANTALTVMKKEFKHLHHELMEIVEGE